MGERVGGGVRLVSWESDISGNKSLYKGTKQQDNADCKNKLCICARKASSCEC